MDSHCFSLVDFFLCDLLYSEWYSFSCESRAEITTKMEKTNAIKCEAIIGATREIFAHRK